MFGDTMSRTCLRWAKGMDVDMESERGDMTSSYLAT